VCVKLDWKRSLRPLGALIIIVHRLVCVVSFTKLKIPKVSNDNPKSLAIIPRLCKIFIPPYPFTVSSTFIWTWRSNLLHTAITYHHFFTISLWAQNLPFQKILSSTLVCFCLSDWSHGSRPITGFICSSVLCFSYISFCFSYSFLRQTVVSSLVNFCAHRKMVLDWLIDYPGQFPRTMGDLRLICVAKFQTHLWRTRRMTLLSRAVVNSG